MKSIITALNDLELDISKTHAETVFKQSEIVILRSRKTKLEQAKKGLEEVLRSLAELDEDEGVVSDMDLVQEFETSPDLDDTAEIDPGDLPHG